MTEIKFLKKIFQTFCPCKITKNMKKSGKKWI